MTNERAITLSSGVILSRDETQREMVVPPRTGIGTWGFLFVVPLFVFILKDEMHFADRPADQTAGILFVVGVVLWMVAIVVDTLTRRTVFTLTPTSVTMRSVGFLGVRSAECARGAFRYGHFVRPRRGMSYTVLYFGGKPMRVCRNWDAPDVNAILVELQEWAHLPAAPGAEDEVVLVNSRLRVTVEGQDRSVEIPAPRGNAMLLVALPLLTIWGAGWLFASRETSPREPPLLRWVGVAFAAVAGYAIYRTIDMLTTRTLISVTPKYVALSSKGFFTRKSYTCARADFIILGYRGTTRNRAISGLELQFGNTTALVLRGADARDVAEVIDVLTSWLAAS